MSATQLTTARAIWRARRPQHTRDTVYRAYALVLVAITAGAPLAHLLWQSLTSPAGAQLLTSASASTVVSTTVALIWAAALVVGQRRGPALLSPFLLHALIDSGMPRTRALRRSWGRACATLVAGFSGAAALLGLALSSMGAASARDVIVFALAGAAAGLVTTSAWLTGQALPRTATVLALAVLALSAVALGVPHLPPVLPWQWVGASYPHHAAPSVAPAGVLLLAAVLTALAGPTLNRLTRAGLMRQAAQWERAKTVSSTFDFGAAAAIYDVGPRRGQHLRAVRLGTRRAVTFVVRDVIGQVRRPARFAAAVGAVVGASILTAFAAYSSIPASAWLIMGSGLVLYVASGTLAQGLRYAARVTGDLPLYGISDLALVSYHAVFPAVAMVAIPTIVSLVTCAVASTGFGIAAAAPLLGLLALAIRFCGSLKGPLPLALLAPVHTPAGDANIILQLVWAFGELILVLLAGWSVAVLTVTPVPLVAVVLGVCGLGALRWRRRR